MSESKWWGWSWLCQAYTFLDIKNILYQADTEIGIEVKNLNLDLGQWQTWSILIWINELD